MTLAPLSHPSLYGLAWIDPYNIVITPLSFQLVENSKTFQIKTEFSQEKYLNKKEQKYGEWVEILRPNIRLLAKFFYQEDPTKVM